MNNKSKKFKINRFREFLLEIHTKPMKEQEKIINSTFDDWSKGEKQIDDILVIGAKI